VRDDWSHSQSRQQYIAVAARYEAPLPIWERAHTHSRIMRMGWVAPGPFQEFVHSTAALTPQEKAKALEASTYIRTAHQSSAQEGQTSAPEAQDDVNLHFVCFVHKAGKLWELDGRKPVSKSQSRAAYLEPPFDLSFSCLVSFGPWPFI
jgi:hypothetical protein